MKLLRFRSLKLALILAGFLLAGYLFFHQSVASAPAKTAALPMVSLVAAQVKSLPLTLTTQGHAISLNQVDIQSQLTGTVKSVAFKEGDFVHQGQRLFTLDDSSQQANLHHALVAQMNKAQSYLARGRALKAKKLHFGF